MKHWLCYVMPGQPGWYDPYAPPMPPGYKPPPPTSPGGQGAQQPAGSQQPKEPENKPPTAPPSPPPTTAQKTGSRPKGEVLSVQKTSGEDRYIVRTQIPGGDKGTYKQTIMSAEEIRRAGGEIPIGNRPWGQGAGVRWASPETPTVESTERDKKKALEIPDELKDYPKSVQQAYQDAVKDGKNPVTEVNKAIKEYNEYSKRRYESLQAAAFKRDYDISQIIKSQSTNNEFLPPGVKEEDYERAMDLAVKLGAAYKKANSPESINEAISIIDREITKQNNAIALLEPYRVGEGFDLGKFISDNPNRTGIQTLQDAGFKSDVIEGAEEFVDKMASPWEKLESSDLATQLTFIKKALGSGIETQRLISRTDKPLDRLDGGQRMEVLSAYIEYGGSPYKSITSDSLHVAAESFKIAAPFAVLQLLGGANIAYLSTAMRAIEKLALAGMGGYGEYQVIRATDPKNLPPGQKPLTPVEVAIYSTLNGLMMLPLAIGAGKGVYKWVKEPGEAVKQRQIFDNMLGKNRDNFINEAIPPGTPNRAQIISNYDSFINAVRMYGDKTLELNQARYLKNEIGFAETKGELKLLDLTNIKIKQLETQTAELRAGVLQKGQRYVDLINKTMKVDDPRVKDEVSMLPKQAIKDMDAATEQIVKPRSISEIKQDIDKAIRETAGLQRGEKITGKELIKQTEYLDQLNRELYYSRIAELNRAYKVAMKAPIKAEKMKISQTPEGQKLTIEAIKRFPEGIEKTTEPMAGRESYAGIIEKLDRLENRLNLEIRDKALRTKVKEAIKEYQWAITLKDPEMLAAAARRLELTTRALPKQLKGPGSDWFEVLNKTMKETDSYVKTEGPSAWEVFKGTEETAGSIEARIKVQAERILEDRWDKLTDRLPESIKRRSREEIRKYLEERYGKKEIEEQLDIENIESELRREQIESTETKTRIESREKELDLYKKWRDSAKDPEKKKKFQELLDVATKQQKRDKELLTQVKEKVKEPMIKTAKTGENLPAKVEKETLPSKESKKIAERVRKESSSEKAKPLPGTEKTIKWWQKKEAERTAADKAAEREWEREFQRAMPSQRKKMLEEAGIETADSRAYPYIRIGVVPSELTKGLPAITPAPKPGIETKPVPAPELIHPPKTEIKPETPPISGLTSTPETIIETPEITPTNTPTEITTPPEKSLTSKTDEKKNRQKSDIGGDKKEWTPEEVKSAIAWRDGFAVHAIKSPYRRGIDEKSFHVNHLPQGLKVMDFYKGPGSQERSAKVTGTLPAELTVDVGNQDVHITPIKKTGRVRLMHVRDTTGTRSMTTVTKNRNSGIKSSLPPGVISRSTGRHRRNGKRKRGRIIY